MAPIRISERDAFADNVPRRDLLVSPDHAIFVDGKLICARQLVNGTTIRRETGVDLGRLFPCRTRRARHPAGRGAAVGELSRHRQQGFFANVAPLVLHPDLTDETGHPTREVGSCAPFVWDEANVQPVWQRLADRAGGSSRRATTTDADPRLVIDQCTVKPVFSDSDRVIFMLPRDASKARLVSRAQSPTEARPWLSDQRRLGMRVKRIVLRDADETREVPMDHPDITLGWWDIEHDGPMMSRWTDGEAVLPLPPMRGPAMLEVHLAGAMTYVVDAVPDEVAEHRAAA